MKTTRVICWLSVALSIACAAELFEYLAENQDNHTSFEPWLLSAVFGPTAVVGMIHLIRTRRLALPAVLAIAVGVFGMATLYYIDHTNRMLQYERWLARGLPPRR